jgi:hypothetical protein
MSVGVCVVPCISNYLDAARKLAREAFLRTAIRQQIRHQHMIAISSISTSAAPPSTHTAASSSTPPLTSEQLKEMAQHLELMSNTELKHLLLQLSGWTELATVNRLVLRSTAIVAQVGDTSHVLFTPPLSAVTTFFFALWDVLLLPDAPHYGAGPHRRVLTRSSIAIPP